jgi:glycosyltransferase involved in cell wall biosynthesis
MTTPLSVCLITQNEEKYIERCLRSVAWADDVVVIDAMSSDRSKEIASTLKGNIRWIENPWPGFRQQRNFALSQAKHDWVLVIDADEECSPELAEKLRALLANPGGPPLEAYKVRRQEYFLGKPIFFGIWNPSFQDRFYNKVGVEYLNEIHEYPRFKLPPGRIEEPLLHAPDFNPDRFLDKMNRYTTVEARDRVAAGKRTNAFRILFAFPAMFLKNYFYYRAYRDGYHGFVISILEGISRAVRHVKIWQLTRKLK